MQFTPEINEIESNLTIYGLENIVHNLEIAQKTSALLKAGITASSQYYPASNIQKSLDNYSLVENDNGSPIFSIWNEFKSDPSIKPFLAIDLVEDSEVLAAVIGKIFDEGNDKFRSKRMHINWVVSQTALKNGNPMAKGATQRIYAELENFAKTLGCNYMSAGIVDINKPSLCLHQKFGFSKIPNTPEMANSGRFYLNGKFTPVVDLSGPDINGTDIIPAKLEYYWKIL